MAGKPVYTDSEGSQTIHSGTQVFSPPCKHFIVHIDLYTKDPGDVRKGNNCYIRAQNKKSRVLAL